MIGNSERPGSACVGRRRFVCAQPEHKQGPEPAALGEGRAEGVRARGSSCGRGTGRVGRPAARATTGKEEAAAEGSGERFARIALVVVVRH